MSDWSEKRVLLTGGRGFLGSHVLKALREADVGYVYAPSHGDLDLLEKGDTLEAMARARPDVVIHCAAQVGGIGANEKWPGVFMYENMMMGANVAHAALMVGVERFVNVGTVCSYPAFAPVPFSERDLWNGRPEPTNAPYGLAKRAVIALLQAYREQYGFPGITVIPTNLYGPHDNFDPETSHVIPALMRKIFVARFKRQDSVTLWGDGSPTREFLYVEDAARGILAAAAGYDDWWPVNLGSGEEVSIRELAEMIAHMLRYEGKIEWDTTRPNGQMRRLVDSSEARTRFGFTASTSLRDGLRKTLSYAMGYVFRPEYIEPLVEKRQVFHA